MQNSIENGQSSHNNTSTDDICFHLVPQSILFSASGSSLQTPNWEFE